MRIIFGIAVLNLLLGCGGESASETPVKAPALEAASAEWAHVGGPFVLTKKTPVKSLLSQPASFVGQTVRVEATAADVCQKKGCWLVIASDEKTMRVMAKDHAFGIDTDSTGALVDIEGQIVEVAADPKAAAHFAGEAAKPELIPAGEGAMKTYQLVATAISVRRQG